MKMATSVRSILIVLLLNMLILFHAGAADKLQTLNLIEILPIYRNLYAVPFHRDLLDVNNKQRLQIEAHLCKYLEYHSFSLMFSEEKGVTCKLKTINPDFQGNALAQIAFSHVDFMDFSYTKNDYNSRSILTEFQMHEILSPSLKSPEYFYTRSTIMEILHEDEALFQITGNALSREDDNPYNTEIYSAFSADADKLLRLLESFLASVNTLDGDEMPMFALSHVKLIDVKQTKSSVGTITETKVIMQIQASTKFSGHEQADFAAKFPAQLQQRFDQWAQKFGESPLRVVFLDVTNAKPKIELLKTTQELVAMFSNTAPYSAGTSFAKFKIQGTLREYLDVRYVTQREMDGSNFDYYALEEDLCRTYFAFSARINNVIGVTGCVDVSQSSSVGDGERALELTINFESEALATVERVSEFISECYHEAYNKAGALCFYVDLVKITKYTDVLPAPPADQPAICSGPIDNFTVQKEEASKKILVSWTRPTRPECQSGGFKFVLEGRTIDEQILATSVRFDDIRSRFVKVALISDLGGYQYTGAFIEGNDPVMTTTPEPPEPSPEINGWQLTVQGVMHRLGKPLAWDSEYLFQLTDGYSELTLGMIQGGAMCDQQTDNFDEIEVVSTKLGRCSKNDNGMTVCEADFVVKFKQSVVEDRSAAYSYNLVQTKLKNCLASGFISLLASSPQPVNQKPLPNITLPSEPYVVAYLANEGKQATEIRFGEPQSVGVPGEFVMYRVLVTDFSDRQTTYHYFLERGTMQIPKLPANRREIFRVQIRMLTLAGWGPSIKHNLIGRANSVGISFLTVLFLALSHQLLQWFTAV